MSNDKIPEDNASGPLLGLGLSEGLGLVPPTCKTHMYGDLWDKRAVGKMLAAERERCAKLCDDLDNDENSGEYQMAAHWAACRIRGA